MSGIEVGADQGGLCTPGSPGGLRLCPPCSAPSLWALCRSEATAGLQLDPVPLTGERLPAALGSLKALLLLLFFLFFLLFSVSPSSPSPPPLPLVLSFPLLFPLLLPLPLFLPLLLLSAPAPSPRDVSCCAIGRGSPRVVTSWGGETPCRDVTAGWYSTCVAGGWGGDCDSPRTPRGIPCRMSCSNHAPYNTLILQIPHRKSPTAPPALPLQLPAPLQHPCTTDPLQLFLHPLNPPPERICCLAAPCTPPRASPAPFSTPI